MDAADFDERATVAPDDVQAIHCTACDAALESPGRDTISFLLLDQLTIPVVGCPDHADQFRATCGLTTEGDATALEHRPAGGLQCPGCRHVAHRSSHPVLPVGNGAVAVLACPTHRNDILGRYRAGLEAHRHLTTTLPTE